jgi:hypothetical protein
MSVNELKLKKMSITQLKSKLTPIEKRQEEFIGNFEKLVDSFANKVSDISLVQWTGKANQFSFSSYIIEFVLLWEDKWWTKKEINVKIEIRHESYDREIGGNPVNSKIADDKFYNFKTPLLITIDIIGNLTLHGVGYVIEEDEASEVIIIEICKAIGILF